MKTTRSNMTSDFAEQSPFELSAVIYLAEKFHKCRQEVLTLFIECDYSFCNTAALLQQPVIPS